MKRKPVVEYLYISTGKMAALDEGVGFTNLESDSLSLTVAPVSFQVNRSGRSRPENFLRLERLGRQLLAQSVDYRDLGATPQSWIRFETDIHWATMHRDSGPDGEDRVAVFTTTFPRPEDETTLILLGSTCHLLDRTGSVGRMGSNSNALYRLVKNPGLIDLQGHNLPRSAVDAAANLDRILTREAPRWQKEHLEGLAKIMHITGEDYYGRIVVATPLYVRVAAPKSFKSRRALKRRRKYVEKHGTVFVPGRR